MTKIYPLPTDIQYENFAEHICEALSWYKHIPFFDGAEFIFFLSENAGGDFTKDRPRLHYAWTTTEEYRQRFGYLDYAYRMCTEDYFHRDSLHMLTAPLTVQPETLGSSFTIRPKNLDYCSVIVYPFVSYDSDTLRSVILMNNYDNKLAIDGSHPNRIEIIRWLDECQKSVDIWNMMSDSEIDIVIQIDDINLMEIDKYNLPTNVVKYLQQEEVAHQPYIDLQAGELSKIRKGLSNLQQLASQGLPIWY